MNTLGSTSPAHGISLDRGTDVLRSFVVVALLLATGRHQGAVDVQLANQRAAVEFLGAPAETGILK
jgi:hypothetical protein